MSTIVFQADVDPQVRDEAVAVLAEDGLTVSDAIRQMLTYIAIEGRVPYFDCFVPNADTLEAMDSVEKGDMVTIGSLANLMDDLNNDEDD